MNHFKILLVALVLSLPPVARAADDNAGDSDELKLIEVELDRAAPKPAPEVRNATAPADVVPNKPVDFETLGRLNPFTEVSVIQKRYMPKTGRFQAFGGLSLVTNDPFNNSYGGALKGSYFFSESMGLEFTYSMLSTSAAKATSELKAVQGVITDNFIITKNYMTLDFMWVPIYGKLAWFNRRIIPFDLYFSAGPGTTKTGTESAATIHLAAGQIFAASKSTAFRWDFSWNFFNATGLDQKQAAYNNLFLTVGWSWFFPEAGYR